MTIIDQHVTSLGVGVYRANEEHQSIADRMYDGNGTRRGILFCHAVSQPGRGWRGNPTKDKIYALASAGYPVLSCDFGAPTYNGQTWGNDDSIAAVADGITFLRDRLGASAAPVGLLGSSMGAQTALAFARAFPSEVFAVGGMVPVLDVSTTIYVETAWMDNWGGIAHAYGLGDTTITGVVNVATFAGAGVLNVVDTTAFAASGTLALGIRNGGGADTRATISYTGKTGTTFTGCTLLTGTGTTAAGDFVVVRDLPSMATHEPTAFGISDLAGLPVRLWTASNDAIAATTAEALAWNGAGSTKVVTDLGAVGHLATSVDPQQVVQFFDDNGGRT